MQHLAAPQQKRVSPKPLRYRRVRGRLSSSSQRLIYHGSIFKVILKSIFHHKPVFAQDRSIRLETPHSIPSSYSVSYHGERRGNTEHWTDVCRMTLPFIERGLRVEGTTGTAVLHAAGFITAQGWNQVNWSYGMKINFTVSKAFQLCTHCTLSKVSNVIIYGLRKETSYCKNRVV